MDEEMKRFLQEELKKDEALMKMRKEVSEWE